MDFGTVLLALAAVGVGYVLLSILRAILFPPQPRVIEYQPKQARARAGGA